MAWIESHQELWRHPKTKKLARLLGISLPTAVGHLHGLWYWAIDFAKDGDLTRYEPEEIADAVLWEREAAAFLDALVTAGYADRNDQGIHLHDWDEYAGKLLDQRVMQREQSRLRKQRQRDKEYAMRDSYRAVTRDIHDENVTERDGHTPTVPNSTLHNSTEPYTEDHALPPGNSDSVASTQEERFATFWSAYPKKTGKQAAIKLWMRLKPTAELFDRIMAAVRAQQQTEQWRQEHGRYIPNPATWLNQGRWDDEPIEAPRLGSNPNVNLAAPLGGGTPRLTGFQLVQDDDG